MKKQLLKSAFLAVIVLFCTSTMQAQTYEEYSTPGIYKLRIPGEDLVMTVDVATSTVIWSAELPSNDQTQLLYIQDHMTPASAGLMQITADFNGT